MKFKPGDLVIIKPDKKHLNNFITLNQAYEVVKCEEYPFGLYIKDDSGFITNYFTEDFDLYKVSRSYEPEKTEKQCVCESRDLMWHGCKCGAVEKKQWGLR